jgi:galactokinase
MNAHSIGEALVQGRFDPTFRRIYKDNVDSLHYQRERYIAAVQEFENRFGSGEARLFSTPGRTEVGGNHTDHNAGHVLAASVDLDVLAVAAKNGSDRVRVWSDGYGMIEVSTLDLSIDESRFYTSGSILTGVLRGLLDLGFAVGGFDAFVTSDVLRGSGLSSSAAFEVCMVTVLNHLYNDGAVDDVTCARIAQFAENDYFGKPCGLMDQTTCAVGGFVTIDFEDFVNPGIVKVPFEFARSGYTLCVVDTGGDHADLNEDYTALEHEMKSVARALGADVLRRTSKKAVLDNLATLRGQVNDRAILRAIHFFDDDEKVLQQVDALNDGDFGRFMELIIASGLSSFMYCQNVYANCHWEKQGLSVALAISENVLRGRGAWRVHGGGFAGTIQSFVPEALLPEYRAAMVAVFGEKSFYELMVRPCGTMEIVASA